MSLFIEGLPPFHVRLWHVFVALLILLDGLICFFWRAPLYLVCLTEKPYAFDLVSGFVGRAAINGHRWAHRWESVIDAIFGKGHCRRVATIGVFGRL